MRQHMTAHAILSQIAYNRASRSGHTAAYTAIRRLSRLRSAASVRSERLSAASIRSTAPNNGEGFDKNLGGNQLPNAPHFTTSLSAEYTMPVSEDWAATLHSDFYWQSQSWARVFNDRPYDKIRGYSNVNLALILTSASGWQVMGYLKNVFNTTAITGDFLNSDDTRADDQRVPDRSAPVWRARHEELGEGETNERTDQQKRQPRHHPLETADGASALALTAYVSICGASASAEDSDRPLIWIELGGQLERLNGPQEHLSPPFMPSITRPIFVIAAECSETAALCLRRRGKISFQPDDSDWVFSASIRYGRSSADRHTHQQTANADVACRCHSHYYGKYVAARNYYPDRSRQIRRWRSARKASAHAFSISRPARMLGLACSAAGLVRHQRGRAHRAVHVQVERRACAREPDLQYPSAPITYFRGICAIQIHDPHTFPRLCATMPASASFHGMGPSLSWNALGAFRRQSADMERSTLDWGVNAAILFGRQKSAVAITRRLPHLLSRYGWLNISQSDYCPHTSTRRNHSNRIALCHRAQCRRLCGLSYRYHRCQSQLRLSRRFFLRRHGRRHRCAQNRQPRLQRPLSPASASALGLNALRAQSTAATDCGSEHPLRLTRKTTGGGAISPLEFSKKRLF